MRPLKIALLSLTLAAPSLAFAIGGNDPVPGIDIIIKKNPGSKPIANIPLTDSEMSQYNALKENDRPVYLSKVIVPKLEQVNKKYDYDIKWDDIIEKGVNQDWCTPERCNMKTRVVIQLEIPESLSQSDVKFSLASQSDTVIEKRTIRRVTQMERR